MGKSFVSLRDTQYFKDLARISVSSEWMGRGLR